jgi:hypothetical protein
MKNLIDWTNNLNECNCPLTEFMLYLMAVAVCKDSVLNVNLDKYVVMEISWKTEGMEKTM